MADFESHKELISKLESVYITPRKEAHKVRDGQPIKFPTEISIPEYNDWDKVKEIKQKKNLAKQKVPKEKPSAEKKNGTRSTSSSVSLGGQKEPHKFLREKVWEAGNPQ